MGVISTYLDKLKLSEDNMSPDEKETVKRWRSILKEGEITLESITEYIEHQKHRIEAKFGDLDVSDRKTKELQLLHSVYSKLLGLINSPKSERDNLENYLAGMIDSSQSDKV